MFISGTCVYVLHKPQNLGNVLSYMSKAAAIQDSSRPFAKRVIAPLFLVFVIFYLVFHAVSGERGVVALFKETRKLDQLQLELAGAKAQRELLEHKVHLLSDNSLDLDLLDEQSRRVLGLADKSEVIYFMDDKKSGQN